MIRGKVVFSVFDKKVQQRMLRKSDLTLKDAVDTCRSAESSQSQLEEIRKGDVMSVSEVEVGAANQRKCFLCSGFGHVVRDCPSRDAPEEEKGNQCFNCKGYGHASRNCPTGDSYPQKKRKKSRRGRERGRGRGNRTGSSSTHKVAELE